MKRAFLAIEKEHARKNLAGGTIMHTKTVEGLTGASMSMKMMNTPFRVFKDAERRGDLAVMERAMGYVNEFANEAEGYQILLK